VKHVLTAMTIFQLLVIDPPIWLDKAIDRLCRGFLWNNDEIAQGEKCLVSWASVCRPISTIKKTNLPFRRLIDSIEIYKRVFFEKKNLN
jgi:hypothetical protein